MSMRALVESLVGSSRLAPSIVYRHEIPSSQPRFRDPKEGLSPALRAAARRMGADPLYAHQAEALDRVRAGRDVAVVTPTASGKSLVNYLPTAELLAGGDGHALYVFPHKALEQDQLEKLRVFGRGLFGSRSLTAEIYDGDTPPSLRRKIRAEPPDVLITNPEMLHLGLIPYHGEWARFFASLRLVVLDELHVYRGVFGSHFAHVMRRLDRVTARYGAEPRYLVGSATIGNPEEFTQALLGRPFDVLTESGSPRAGRHFLFVNPAGSPYTAATRVLIEAVRAGHRTIAFTKARRITELMHSWVAQGSPELADRIASYRAGYLPEERREIERRLFRGDLTGVVATSALELGIDVGGLDVCILVGYPGSMLSSWQRAGRVGRKDRESLTVFVAQPDALDQYFIGHPREFFERKFERAVVDPDNPIVASAHAVCAASEIPLARAEALDYVGTERLGALVAEGRLVEDETGKRLFSLIRRPQRDVSLRSGAASYAILAEEGNRPIGTIDGVRVFHECHEGAIYLHGGQSYRIVRIDEEARRVLAVRFSGDYYTQALGEKETEILEVLSEIGREGYRLSFGRLKVTVRIREYAKKRLTDQATISKHPLQVPPIVFETVGFWMTLPDALEQEAVLRERHFMGGLHGSEHAMISLFPLLALCDRSDIGGISYSRNMQLGAPAIFIYDGHPGGIGLAQSVHDRIEDLFAATRRLLDTCPCEDGCPSCVQSPKCGSGNRPLDKESSRLVLAHLSGGIVTFVPREPPSLEPSAPGPRAQKPGDALRSGEPSVRDGFSMRASLPDAGPVDEPPFDLQTFDGRRSGGQSFDTQPLDRQTIDRQPFDRWALDGPPPPAPGAFVAPLPLDLDPRFFRRSTVVRHPLGRTAPRSLAEAPPHRPPAEPHPTLPGLAGSARAMPAGPASPLVRVREPRPLLSRRAIRSGAAWVVPVGGAPDPHAAGALETRASTASTAAFAPEPATSPAAAPPAAFPATLVWAPFVVPGGFRLRAGEGRVIVFDLETQRSAAEVGGWRRIRDMRLALAVVYDVRRNTNRTYFEKDVDSLLLDLVMSDRVIGYNSERFDLAVLSAYGDWDLGRIRSFDMLRDIRRRFGLRLKLADLAAANLGEGKSADGLQSLAWFREGRLDLIEEYCRRDVEVTARLYFLGRERRHLLLNHREGVLRLPVDW